MTLLLNQLRREAGMRVCRVAEAGQMSKVAGAELGELLDEGSGSYRERLGALRREGLAAADIDRGETE